MKIPGINHELSGGLQHLYTPCNKVKIIKSIWIRWTEHVACRRKLTNAYKICVAEPQCKRPLGDLRVKY
jgi:hypothetical protein